MNANISYMHHNIQLRSLVVDIISEDVELVTINFPLQFAQHEERCR